MATPPGLFGGGRAHIETHGGSDVPNARVTHRSKFEGEADRLRRVYDAHRGCNEVANLYYRVVPILDQLEARRHAPAVFYEVDDLCAMIRSRCTCAALAEADDDAELSPIGRDVIGALLDPANKPGDLIVIHARECGGCGAMVPEAQWIDGPDRHNCTTAPRDCEGHPAGPFDPMGETFYCDGTCAVQQ